MNFIVTRTRINFCENEPEAEIKGYLKREVGDSLGDLYQLINDFRTSIPEIHLGPCRLKIKNVIFNDPATIVFWADGTKTVVKAQGDDIFDPEKGLAMAISKKALGNKGNYCNELKKWLPKKGILGPYTMSELDAYLTQIAEVFTKNDKKKHCYDCKHCNAAINNGPCFNCVDTETHPNWEPRNA